MRIIFICLSVLLTLTSFSEDGSAKDLVNTGAGNNQNGGYAVSANQWLAGKFTLTGTDHITDMYGWIADFGRGNDPVTLRIYSNTNARVWNPETQPVLFNGTFVTGKGSTPGWYGLSGLDLALQPGSYWIGFEVRDDSGFSGAMPFGAPDYLATEAHWAVANNGYLADMHMKLGFKIESNPAPEPVSSALFGVGAIAFGIFRRNKRNNVS